MELAKVILRIETSLIQVIEKHILFSKKKKERFNKSNGILLGGCLAVFFTVLTLIGVRVFG